MVVKFKDVMTVGLATVAAVYAGRSMWRMLNGKTRRASNGGRGDEPPKR